MKISGIKHNVFNLFYLAFLFCIATQKTIAQQEKTIYLTTKYDSIEFYFGKIYSSKYVFEEPQDSLYVKISHSITEDMGSHSVHPFYKFSDSIPDGQYTIVLDGVFDVKTSFKNRQKNGLSCKYLNNGSYSTYLFKNNAIVEYALIDKHGNVLEYSPCLHPKSHMMATDFMYHFSPQHDFTGITYAFSLGSLIVTDQFENGGYVSTNIQPRNYGLEQQGFLRAALLNGTVTARWEDEQYTFIYKNGTLLAWNHSAPKFAIVEQFDAPSNSIPLVREDLLEFCRPK